MEHIEKAPVYHQTAAYAKEHGELDQYRASNLANIACRSEIERNISENFDGMYLGEKCVQRALGIYGAERVCFVLACTAQQKEWDGRFSRDNKAWANGFDIPRDDALGFDRRAQYVVESHPAILDGYIKLMRKAVLEEEKPSVQAALQKHSAKVSPLHPCKKSEPTR